MSTHKCLNSTASVARGHSTARSMAHPNVGHCRLRRAPSGGSQDRRRARQGLAPPSWCPDTVAGTSPASCRRHGSNLQLHGSEVADQLGLLFSTHLAGIQQRSASACTAPLRLASKYIAAICHRVSALSRSREVTETGTCAWPSLAPGKRATLAFFPGQARSVRLAPGSQAPVHLQLTKQVRLSFGKPGQDLATLPNTPFVACLRKYALKKHLSDVSSCICICIL